MTAPGVRDVYEFAAPTRVSETLDLLGSRGADVRLLAGGQSLMILLRQRLVTPDLVVSLKRVGELSGIAVDGDMLHIGAMTTYRQAAGSAEVRAWAPALAAASSSVGSIHIRNVGTVGGALCHADPAGDVSTVLLTLDATLDVARTGGQVSHPVDGFFTGLYATRLGERDLLRSVGIPRQPHDATFGYRRFCLREGEYPMAIAACRLEWEGGRCRAARVAVGGGFAHPTRITRSEHDIVGTAVDERVRRGVREDLAGSLEPPADVRGSSRWKARVIAALVEDALEDAVERRRHAR